MVDTTRDLEYYQYMKTICDFPHTDGLPCLFCTRDDAGELVEAPHQLLAVDPFSYELIEYDERRCGKCSKLMVLLCADEDGPLVCHECCANPGPQPCLVCGDWDYYVLECNDPEHRDVTANAVRDEYEKDGW